jgi:hypothetical protein
VTAVVIALVAVLAVGIALGVFALSAPRRSAPAAVQAAPIPPWQSTTEWTKAAGEEFAGLSEAARCDLIFAVNDLRDERSMQSRLPRRTPLPLAASARRSTRTRCAIRASALNVFLTLSRC